MNVYFLSGLGADKTVFQFLDLDFCDPCFLDWIPPHKNEALAAYALRMKSFYRIPDDAAIVGLSFGGMLATELAKQFPGLKAVLISGAKTKQEIPSFYRTGKYLSLHNWSSPKMQRWFMLHIKWLFGLKTPEYIKTYEALIARSDTGFNKWAVNALLRWENNHVPTNVWHIHGKHDRILPYKNITCNHTIPAAGHLMVMEQATIVSSFLKNTITAASVPFSSASLFEHPYQV